MSKGGNPTALAVGGCQDSPEFPNELTDWYRVCYFGKATPHTCYSTAKEQAQWLARKWRETEYGICDVVFDRPLLPITEEYAERRIDEYWEAGAHDKAAQENTAHHFLRFLLDRVTLEKSGLTIHITGAEYDKLKRIVEKIEHE